MNDIVDKMKSIMGSVFALYFDTHSAHWNVEGIAFRELHELFKDQYEDLWESIDDIAEHIRALDAYTPQTLGRLVGLNELPAIPEPMYDYKEVLLALKEGHERIVDMMTEANLLAQDAQLQGLSNYLCGRIEVHNKHRWMLRASAK